MCGAHQNEKDGALQDLNGSPLSIDLIQSEGSKVHMI